MKRRAFLLLPLALSTVSTARLFAAPSTSSRFLLVFLRGGYDAANVLIPHSSDYYYQVRPNIAVPRDAVLKLDSDWALHPALRESLYALWLRGETAFVPFAGSHDLSRSHFESQDTLELGQPLRGGRPLARDRVRQQHAARLPRPDPRRREAGRQHRARRRGPQARGGRFAPTLGHLREVPRQEAPVRGGGRPAHGP